MAEAASDAQGDGSVRIGTRAAAAAAAQVR
jgi:hypothetical protein